MIHRAVTEPEGWIAVSLSKAILGRAGRYSASALGKTLPDVLERLAAPGLALLELVKGHQRVFGPARQSTMRATPALLRRVEAAGIDLDDLGRETSDEVIILKSARESVWDGGDWIEYEDTPTTRRYRDEVQRVNRWLEQADITFDPASAPERVVDESDRALRRYFNNGSFEEGGRLFGGFWINLSKKERHEGIEISGERVTSLDYSQMAPRIVYGLAGQVPPVIDAYTIPGFERHRPGVKKVFNALLYSTKTLARLPKGSKPLLPRGTKIGEVVQRLTMLHQPIARLFCTGIGYRGMFTESSILVAALLSLIDEGIVALPVHDALIVPRPAATLVTSIMLNTFKGVTGVEGMVEVDDE